MKGVPLLEHPILVRATLTWPSVPDGYPPARVAQVLSSNGDLLQTTLTAVVQEAGRLNEQTRLSLVSVTIAEPAGAVDPARRRMDVELALRAERAVARLSNQTLQRIASTIEAFARVHLGQDSLDQYTARCVQLVHVPAEPAATEIATAPPAAAGTPVLSPKAKPRPSTHAGKRTVGALILKGGGVKGLAFAGALQVLEKYFHFEANAGASAGAIVAVLRSAGYSSDELLTLLRDTDFKSFLDTPTWLIPLRLLFRGGMHSGDMFRQWIRDRLNDKINGTNAIEIGDLPTRTIVFASSGGTIHFDSEGKGDDTLADFAVRCSMAIPFFFDAVQHGGARVVDGGVLNNFPVRAVQEVIEDLGSDFIALYLGSERLQPLRRQWLPMELLSMWLGQDEKALVDKFRNQTVIIDTHPIHTVQFALSNVHKDYLVAVGRLAALKFVANSGIADVEDQSQLVAQKELVDKLRAQIAAEAEALRSRRVKRLLIVALSAAAVGAALWFFGVLLW